MLVSLCVIAYNEEKALPRLLDDIRLQDYPHGDIEVVFVDDISTDGTKAVMESFAKEQNGFCRVIIQDSPKIYRPPLGIRLYWLQTEILLSA